MQVNNNQKQSVYMAAAEITRILKNFEAQTLLYCLKSICLIFSCNPFKRPSRSFTCIRVNFTVALNLSSAHEANAALGFAEVSDANLLFFLPCCSLYYVEGT